MFTTPRRTGKKTTSRARSREEGPQMNTNAIFIIIILLGAVVGVAFLLDNAGIIDLALVPDETPEEELDTTRFFFFAFDLSNGSALDNDDIGEAEFFIYTVDIEDLDADEIADLEFVDYELDTTKDHAESLLIDNNTKYWYKVNVTTPHVYNTQWIDLAPLAGDKTGIQLLKNASEIKLLAFSTNELDRNLAGTTIREWTILVNMIDEDGDVTESVGTQPFFDFPDDNQEYNEIIFEFNTTADEDWVDSNLGTLQNKKVVGNTVILQFNENFRGRTEIEVKFNTRLNSDFEVVSSAFAFNDVVHAVYA